MKNAFTVQSLHGVAEHLVAGNGGIQHVDVGQKPDLLVKAFRKLRERKRPKQKNTRLAVDYETVIPKKQLFRLPSISKRCFFYHEEMGK